MLFQLYRTFLKYGKSLFYAVMVSILNTIASIAGIDLPFILVLAEDYVVFCLEFFSGIKEFLVITLLQITGKIFRIASAIPGFNAYEGGIFLWRRPEPHKGSIEADSYYTELKIKVSQGDGSFVNMDQRDHENRP